MLLAEHYGQRAERYRAAAQGYVDDKLRSVFPHVHAAQRQPAGQFVRDHRVHMIAGIGRWSGLEPAEVATIVDKLADRADSLDLELSPRKRGEKLVELTSLAASLAKDFAYTGRFTG